MKPDPIVEEVHRIRDALAKRFENNLDAICNDARRRQSISDRNTRQLAPRSATVRSAKAS